MGEVAGAGDGVEGGAAAPLWPKTTTRGLNRTSWRGQQIILEPVQICLHCSVAESWPLFYLLESREFVMP
jgi:hypothetical protein